MDFRKALLGLVAVSALASTAALAEDMKKGPKGDMHPPRGMMGKQADTDGDGYLSKAEFMAVQEARFKEMDADNNAKISKDEMKSHFKSMREKMEKMREGRHERRGEGKKQDSE